MTLSWRESARWKLSPGAYETECRLSSLNKCNSGVLRQSGAAKERRKAGYMYCEWHHRQAIQGKDEETLLLRNQTLVLSAERREMLTAVQIV